MPIFDYSSLIGGAISGLVILGARSYYEYVKESRETKKELSGLMRLLMVEINRNNNIMKAFRVYPRATRPYLPSLTSSSWDESKMRLAGLIENEHYDALLLYYDCIEHIKRELEIAAISKPDTDQLTKALERDFKDAKHHGKLAIAHGSKYMYWNHTELTDQKHKELVESVRKGETPETW